MTQPKDYAQRVDFDIQDGVNGLIIYKFRHVQGSKPEVVTLNELEQRAIYQKLHEKYEGKK